MKKIVSIMLAVVMLGTLASFTACDSGGKKLICGVTDYAPMNFLDADGNWTGFDTEFAQLVGEKLNMTVEFQEINWDNKYSELAAGSINCIWNGFTANAYESDGTPRKDKVDFSYSYMLNQQCVVIKAERADEFKSEADLAGKIAAAENGSAGESFAAAAIGDSGSLISSASQIKTFIEVKSGAVDYAVVDILLALEKVGSGDYADLAIADITLDFEVYAIGFQKGSDLTKKVNDAIKELYDEGKLMELAEKYKLENQLQLDTSFSG